MPQPLGPQAAAEVRVAIRLLRFGSFLPPAAAAAAEFAAARLAFGGRGRELSCDCRVRLALIVEVIVDITLQRGKRHTANSSQGGRGSGGEGTGAYPKAREEVWPADHGAWLGVAAGMVGLVGTAAGMVGWRGRQGVWAWARRQGGMGTGTAACEFRDGHGGGSFISAVR